MVLLLSALKTLVLSREKLVNPVRSPSSRWSSWRVNPGLPWLKWETAMLSIVPLLIWTTTSCLGRNWTYGEFNLHKNLLTVLGNGRRHSVGLVPFSLKAFHSFCFWFIKGNNLKIISSCSVSKQQAIVPGQCYELDDGTSSFKDFHGSRNNRFTSPEQAAKNRIQHPSNVLHFFNAQPDATPEVFSQVCSETRSILLICVFSVECGSVSHTVQTCFLQICEELGVKSPVNVKMFTGKSKPFVFVHKWARSDLCF